MNLDTCNMEYHLKAELSSPVLSDMWFKSLLKPF